MNIKVAPPELKSGEVTSVKIENKRTCATHEISVDPGAAWSTNSVAYNSGEILLNIGDSDTKLKRYLNVREGNNPLTITYFGKCLKAQEATNSAANNESSQCRQSEVLGTQEVLFAIKVSRPELSRVLEIDGCKDDQE